MYVCTCTIHNVEAWRLIGSTELFLSLCFALYFRKIMPMCNVAMHAYIPYPTPWYVLDCGYLPTYPPYAFVDIEAGAAAVLAAVGSTVHVGAVKGGSIVVVGGAPGTRSALTSTGIMPPVARENGRWPTTLRMLVMAPECAVKEMNVLGSWVKTSSRSLRRRASRWESDSRHSACQRGSVSAKPSSKM